MHRFHYQVINVRDIGPESPSGEQLRVKVQLDLKLIEFRSVPRPYEVVE